MSPPSAWEDGLIVGSCCPVVMIGVVQVDVRDGRLLRDRLGLGRGMEDRGLRFAGPPGQ